MTKVSSENHQLVGKVTRSHGLAGLLRVRSYAQTPESFLSAETVLLRSVSGETREFKILSIKPHKNICLMKLEGLSFADEAEHYRDAEIFIRKDALVREGDEEYFWFEIMGLEVYLKTGEHIGTIEEIIPTGSNDVYVVRKGKKETLVPAIEDVVCRIDLARKKMIISEMEGMFELNEV